MTKPEIVLPADVYDTLEFSALVFGGIGAGGYALIGAHRMQDLTDLLGAAGAAPHVTPNCVVGHGAYAGMPEQECSTILGWWGQTISLNDAAVEGINKRKGRTDLAMRVPFSDWCKELNVVRGE